MTNQNDTNNQDLSINDRQLLEKIGQEVIHTSRRKVLLIDKRKNVSDLLKNPPN